MKIVSIVFLTVLMAIIDAGSAFSDDFKTIGIELTETAQKIDFFKSKLDMTSEEYDSVDYYAEHFSTLLRKYAECCDTYPYFSFDVLKNAEGIRFAESDDGAIKTISWAGDLGFSKPSTYKNLIFYRSGTSYKAKYYQADDTDRLDLTHMIDSVITVKSERGNIYLLTGYARPYSDYIVNSLYAVDIQNGNLLDSLKLFETDSGYTVHLEVAIMSFYWGIAPNTKFEYIPQSGDLYFTYCENCNDYPRSDYDSEDTPENSLVISTDHYKFDGSKFRRVMDSAYFAVDNLTDGQAVLPRLSRAGSEKQTEKMNDLISAVTFRQFFPPGIKNPKFENSSHETDEGLFEGCESSFTVRRNDDRMFSAEIMMNCSDMTLHVFGVNFNFDPLSAHNIGMTDLITPEGIDSLGKRIPKAILNALIAGMKADDSDDSDSDDDGYSFIKEAISDFRAYDISVDVAGIWFNATSLMPRAYLSGYGEAALKVELQELLPYLTDYGKYVFRLSDKYVAPVKDCGYSLYEGTIDDKYPIYLLLAPGKTYAEGLYAYKKYGKGINFAGKKTGNDYELSTFDDGEIFKLTAVGPEITGTWIKGDKSLPVKLKIR